MEDRTKKLLNSIIREHIKTAQPVGSSVLVEKYKLDVSSATVRNEMALLEEEGYISQPHTSAGRVPTERGYKFYLDNFLAVKEPTESQKRDLEEIAKKFREDHQQLIKNLAKTLAETSGGMTLVGFSQFDYYYTGLSNIFSQPEFTDQNVVYNLSLVVDHLDEVMARIFSLAQEEPRVLIGSGNPFGNMCSVVLVDYRLGKERGIFGLMGPLRMDYDANIGLVAHARNLINNL